MTFLKGLANIGHPAKVNLTAWFTSQDVSYLSHKLLVTEKVKSEYYLYDLVDYCNERYCVERWGLAFKLRDLWQGW